MRRITILGLALLGGSVLTGCGDEVPTALGSDIVEQGFRTFEVVLEADEFLVSDTTWDGVGVLNGVPFSLVAESFAGELSAHTLFRVNVPRRVSYENADETTITDSVFTIVGGTVTVVLDTLSEAVGPVELEVVALTESWDPATVSWELRYDSTDVSAPWTQPGGTPGAVLGSATWESGDTLRIPVDSAAASAWADSATAFHGAFVRSATPDSRLRFRSLAVDVRVRPETTPDTVVDGAALDRSAVVAFPEAGAPGPGEIRVAGVPTWRSALRFLPLADVEIPCTEGSTTCTLPLSQADIGLAQLLLQPITVGPRRIERPVRIEGRALLRAEGVPLSRSPLSSALGAMVDPVEPDDFLADAATGEPAAVPVTGYVRRSVTAGEEGPVEWLALVTESERAAPAFGYAAFASRASATPPRLRLIVTVPAAVEGQ